jgi:gliding motility-associated-like protein
MRLLLSLFLLSLLFSCSRKEANGFDSEIYWAMDYKLNAAGDTVYKVYFPSGFTPNGDNINDTYQVYSYGVDADNYTMRIHNRYQNFMYYTDDSNSSWDGRIQGHGEYVQPGVYTVLVELKDTTGTDHVYQYKITLAR